MLRKTDVSNVHCVFLLKENFLLKHVQFWANIRHKKRIMQKNAINIKLDQKMKVTERRTIIVFFVVDCPKHNLQHTN